LPSTQTTLAQYAHWLFAQEATFVAGADTAQRIPPTSQPEVAFVGRSNVGKSSLINALTHRRQLARVSHTPGRTQQINFFSLGSKLLLVDLPGYGYANVSHQSRRSWQWLMAGYFQDRRTLRCVFVLIDSRHPLKASDREAMEYFNGCGVPFQMILTKIDQVSALELADRRKELAAAMQNMPMAHRDVLAASARKSTGLDTLRQHIAALCSD
jgi:GTP-binding protein